MSDNNLSSKIEFRISEKEKNIIKIKSKKTGLSISEFCRRSALNKKTIEIFSSQQEVFYKNLINYHNNFSRISNLIKAKDSNVYKEIRELIDFFKREIKNIQNDR